MAKLIFLGTASGFPAADRASSSFLLVLPSAIYQFDCGDGVSRSLVQRKIRVEEIKAIFVSHLHPDHVAGIFLELQLMYLSKRIQPLEIYVPEEGVEGLQKTAEMFYLFADKMSFEYSFIPLRPNPVFRDENIAVYAHPNGHLEPNRTAIEAIGANNKMQSYSLSVVAGSKKLLYSGDIAGENDIKPLLENVHTLVVEGMHGDFGAIAELCATHEVKRVVLTHLSAADFRRPQRFVDLAAKHGLKRLVIARDGLSLSF